MTLDDLKRHVIADHSQRMGEISRLAPEPSRVSCKADRIPMFARAREVAAELAQRIHPVHVAEAPPLEIRAEQPRPVMVSGYTPETPALAKKNGRPVIQEQRASVITRSRANGEVYFVAQVRGANNVRTHLGPHRTREHALAACERFMSTGELPPKPPKLKRGAKIGQQKKPGSRTRWGTLTGAAQPAQRLPNLPVAAPPAPKRSTVSQKAASGQEGPRTTWREIAKRFQ